MNCLHLLPQLRQLEQQFPNELVVLGVHAGKYRTERQTANIREAVARFGITHPVVNDRHLRIWRAYAVNAWPTLVLITPTGRYLGSQPGETAVQAWTPLIQALIGHFSARNELRHEPLDWIQVARDHAPAQVLRYPAKVHATTTTIWIADTGHHRIIEAQLSDSMRQARVSRIFGSGRAGLDDGAAANATFHAPHGLTASDGVLYVADTENHALRGIDLASGNVTTLAGTGKQGYQRDISGDGQHIALSSPWDVVAVNGKIVIAMAGMHQLWVYDRATHLVGAAVGTGFENLVDGPVREALLAQPSGLAVAGATMYVADAEASAIRVAQLDGEVQTLVGTGLFAYGDIDGIGDAAELQHPQGVAVLDELVYIADSYNHRIKRLDPTTRTLTSWAGSGMAGLFDANGIAAQFFEPEGIAATEGHLFIADTNNHVIRVAKIASGEVWTLELEHDNR